MTAWTQLTALCEYIILVCKIWKPGITEELEHSSHHLGGTSALQKTEASLSN